METKIEVEQVFSMPIGGFESGEKFTLKGKIDRMEQKVSGNKIIDYKGVTKTADFIRSRGIDYQPEIYALALADRGIEIDRIEYRLIERPTIRIKQNELPSAYENRCVNVWFPEKPDRILTFSYPITPSAIKSAKNWLIDCIERITANRKANLWIKNTNACDQWHRPCPYVEACSLEKGGGNEKAFLDGELPKQRNRHVELGSDGNGENIVTYSSLSLLALCEQRFKFRYEDGHREEESSDALWTGSALHVGLEKFDASNPIGSLNAIDEWAENNPVLGEDAYQKQITQIMKARAMVRVAAQKWNL